MSTDAPSELSAAIKEEARRLGFSLAGIAPAVSPTGFHRLLEWLQQGYAGQMQYLAARRDAYEHPRGVQPGVRSLVMLAWNYRTVEPVPPQSNQGRVSRYAWGPGDYHEILRERLQQLAEFVHQQLPDCRTRGAVDTAPLLERDFARLAGLGWFGKNTMLINRERGSWFFLASLLVDVELEADEPFAADHCGSCTRCLDACPTNAFPQPYVLDARRCISYLTIEQRTEAIPVEFRETLGEWIFGCDVCQDVCPWNRRAPADTSGEFLPLAERNPVEAVELLELSEEEFRECFRNTPLFRTGRAAVLRNAALVLGNCGDARAVPALLRGMVDPSVLVREAAVWALGRLGKDAALGELRERLVHESEPSVRKELERAIESLSNRLGSTYDDDANPPMGL